MNYDEIDDYVDDLFRQDKPQGSQEVMSGDPRIDRIDEIIEDAYNEAVWWHNSRISDGCDPRSGLRSLPFVPWDEKIDGAAAMQGACAPVESNWRGSPTSESYPAVTPGGAALGTALIVLAAIALCGAMAWMAIYVP